MGKELKTLGSQVYPDLRIPLIVKRLTEALIELEGKAIPVSLFVEGTLTGASQVSRQKEYSGIACRSTPRVNS